MKKIYDYNTLCPLEIKNFLNEYNIKTKQIIKKSNKFILKVVSYGNSFSLFDDLLKYYNYKYKMIHNSDFNSESINLIPYIEYEIYI